MTKSQTTTPRKNLAILDLSHVWRSSWHASEDESISAAFNYTIRAVLRIQQNPLNDYFVCAIDAPPYTRKDVFPEYKANRDKPDMKMIEQYKRVLRKLDAMGVTCWKDEGLEADDIIASACRHAKAAKVDVTIYSADKDLMALLGDGVKMVSTRTGDVITADTVQEKFRVRPGQMKDLLALCGDKSDNIPGCPGVGVVTAAQLLQKYGTLDIVLSRIEDIGGKLGKKLEENREQIILSSVLVELQTHANIPWSDIYLQDKASANTLPSLDEELDSRLDELEDFDAPLGGADPNDIEREAIQEEPTLPSTERPKSNPFLEPTATKDDPFAPGDKLVAGALALRAVAPPVAPEPPTVRPERDSDTEPAPGPGIVRAEPTAPATRDSGTYTTSIELRPGLHLTGGQFKLMRAMATDFHAGGLYRRSFDSAASIFTIMELGLELGLSPQLALQLFHIVEGRPCPSAQYLIARAEQDPNCEYFEMIEETDSSVTYVTKKRRGSGRELSFTYTMQDAEKAGLLGKNTPWKYHPKAMLRKTAGSHAARLWYPSATAGLYSVEEMGYMPDAA